MAVYAFKCKCGAMLVLPTKVRPVCRVPGCGKQMKLDDKVTGRPIERGVMSQFNAKYGQGRVIRP